MWPAAGRVSPLGPWGTRARADQAGCRPLQSGAVFGAGGAEATEEELWHCLVPQRPGKVALVGSPVPTERNPNSLACS